MRCPYKSNRNCTNYNIFKYSIRKKHMMCCYNAKNCPILNKSKTLAKNILSPKDIPLESLKTSEKTILEELNALLLKEMNK